MNTDINKMIGEKIRHYRKANDLTIIELADRLHMSKSVISKYERGEIPVTVEQLMRISGALGIDFSLLLSDFSFYEQSSFFDSQQILREDYDRLYCYSYTGHDKAYLSLSVLLIGNESAILYGEAESEENYQKCRYYYVGPAKNGPSNRRAFLRNTLNEDDIAIIDIPRNLEQNDLQYAFFVTLSTGIFFPLACRWLVSARPVKDTSLLRALLELTRDDLKEYKKTGAFFVPLKDDRLKL